MTTNRESTETNATAEPIWHTIAADEAVRLLDSTHRGLRTEEALRRLERYGPNEIEKEKRRPWPLTLLRQFRDPLIYILLAAALLTLILEDYADTGVILAVVLLNAIIGFVQEQRAQQAMRALAGMSAPQAEVLRNDRTQKLPSRNLVPGDIILLASGVRVPADLRLLHAQGLETDESLLTGESTATQKTNEEIPGEALIAGDQRNMAFAGTIVTRGRGYGVVVRTGSATVLGRIATSMRALGETETPLQKKMKEFGKRLGVLVLALSAVVVVIGLGRGMGLHEIFLAAVAMAVSEIPEGLPVVLTLTFAIGVRHMARRNAVIRSLPAVETLGSTTVIGSDKTGTLTRNEMTVRRIWAGGETFVVTGSGYGSPGAILNDGVEVKAQAHEPLFRTILAGVLANEAAPQYLQDDHQIGDPTELALLTTAAKGGLNATELRKTFEQRGIIPFESELRFMATLNVRDSDACIYMKGAPEAVIGRCDRELTEKGERILQPEILRKEAGLMAAEGLRVLAMAYRPVAGSRLDEDALQGGFIFAGFQGMEDPVRPEAVAAVRDAHEAGIRVIMLTGDHADTAAAIGRRLGLNNGPKEAMEGSELEGLSEEELDRIVREVNIYARVAPEHKLLIVERLKAQGEIVAVTGDGVNDGPALRSAHIGIAMGKSGTDVAREASDIVLTDDNFASITAAVEEGRVVFSNIRKVTFFLLSTAVGEVITLITAIALGWPLPFIAAQILWINLVTNGLQDVALAFEPGEKGLLKQRPRRPDEGIVSGRILERLGSVGLVLAAGTLGIFWWTLKETNDVDLARTMAMTQMVLFQFFHVFNCRSLDRSIFSIPFFSNRFLFYSMVAATGAHLLVLYLPFMQKIFRTVPLDAMQWLPIVLIGSLVVVGGELDKWWNRRRTRPLG